MLRSKYKTKCISYDNTVWPSFHVEYNLSARVHGKTNAHAQSSIIPARNRSITNHNPVSDLNSNLNRELILNELYQKIEAIRSFRRPIKQCMKTRLSAKKPRNTFMTL